MSRAAIPPIPIRVGSSAPSGRTAGLGAGWLWALAFLVCVASFATPNPLPTIACVAALPLFAVLLWRTGEPPILFLIVTLQWLQISTRVLEANVGGIQLDALMSGPSPPVEPAILVGLCAVLTVAVSLRVGAGGGKPSGANLLSESTQLSIMRVFAAYLILAAAGQALNVLAWRLLPVSQLVLVLAPLRLVPLFLLAVLAFTRKEGRSLLGISLGLEVLLGLMGFFAYFKTAFLVIILAAFAARVRLGPRQWVTAGLAGVVLLLLALFWTSIKPAYRSYLNQGTGAQVVLVSWPDRVSFLASQLRNVRPSELAAAVDPMVNRVSHIDLLADVLGYVPQIVPHTDGELWRGAVKHVLMPRLLFPEKAALSDSRVTRMYTGQNVADEDQGTSIGIGYVAESYVDFGVRWMWLPIAALGLLWGLMYRKLLTWAPYQLLGYSVAMVCFLPSTQIETSAAKLLGGSLTRFFVLSILIVAFSRRAWRWMAPSARDRVAGAPHFGRWRRVPDRYP